MAWADQPTIYLNWVWFVSSLVGAKPHHEGKTGGMEEGNAGEKRRKGEDLPATLLSSINKKRSRILT